MIVRIRIRTPPGHAEKIAYQIQPFLIGRRKASILKSPNDDTIIWEVEGDPRNLTGLYRNVAAYGAIINGIFTNKMLSKVIKQKLSTEDQAALKDMLANQTKVELVKAAEEWEK